MGGISTVQCMGALAVYNALKAVVIAGKYLLDGGQSQAEALAVFPRYEMLEPQEGDPAGAKLRQMVLSVQALPKPDVARTEDADIRAAGDVNVGAMAGQLKIILEER